MEDEMEHRKNNRPNGVVWSIASDRLRGAHERFGKLPFAAPFGSAILDRMA